MSAGRDELSADKQPHRLKRGVLIGLAALAVALVAGYVAGYFLTGNRVPSGATVAGVAIGGLSPEDAEAALDRELADLATAPIELEHEGEIHVVDPAEVGMTLDTEQTVLEAGGGHSWNPIRMIELLTGSEHEVEPVVTVDEDALAAAISEVATEVDQPPEEPAVDYTRTGDLRVTEPEQGIDVEEEAAAAAVVQAFLVERAPLTLPVTTVEPDVTADELQTMIDKVARPAVSGPIILRLPSGDVPLPVEDYAPALGLSIDNGRLQPSVDSDQLGRGMADLIERVGERPKDARVVLRGGEPVVVPGKPGVTLDPQEVAEAILPVLTTRGDQRVAEVGTVVARPRFTVANARALEITEKVSEFVTYFPYAEYRNTNQGRAAALIDGTVLEPGEIFSFNDTVGERTVANGFVKGVVIDNGVYAEDLGGGVSQVVTTTYNAAFFAGLKDIEHKPHSFYIDRYPLGREATVAWPSVDLKFQNDTPYGVLINAWVVPSTTVSQGEMHVEMYSTKYWDIDAGVSDRYSFTSPSTRYLSTDDCVSTTGYGGFTVDVYRYFRKPGSPRLVKTETQTVTYIPADTVICSAPPSAEPDGGGGGDGNGGDGGGGGPDGSGGGGNGSSGGSSGGGGGGNSSGGGGGGGN
jgi:vancomycin resistance protein YoaR